MAESSQTGETAATATEQRVKVAAKCRQCGAVYSAWILADDTVQPIGRKNGCQCGASQFEALST